MYAFLITTILINNTMHNVHVNFVNYGLNKVRYTYHSHLTNSFRLINKYGT